MMQEARARILLTTSNTHGFLAAKNVTVVKVDSILDGPQAALHTDDPMPACTTGNTAYVIFTSGSTGTPKGVAVAHRAVNNLLHWCYRTYHFSRSDVGLAVASLGFDLSVFDLFGLLGAGRRPLHR